MATPEQLGTGTEIGWTIPTEVSTRNDLDQIRVFRSTARDSNYALLDTISYSQSGSALKSYIDSSEGNSRGVFYLVSFVSTASSFESAYQITFFPPLPSEMFLIEQVRRTIPPILQSTLTNEDYMNGLYLALQIFNTYPPETEYTISNFPRTHLYFLIGLAQMLALVSRYVPLSVRDFRYSEPGGVVMDIDRGAKVIEAINLISKIYTQYLPLVKLDFSDSLPLGLGTVQLPLSMGGVVSRGLLNILDIFTAVGR